MKNLLSNLPEYSKSLGISLVKIISNNNEISSEHLSGAILTAGYAIANDRLLNHIRAYAKLIIDDESASMCKNAAVMTKAISSYITIKHSSCTEIAAEELGLINSINNKENADELVNFSLCCYAASIVMECRDTITEFENKLLNSGFNEQNLAIIQKIVALLKGIALSMFIESARTHEFGRGPNYS